MPDDRFDNANWWHIPPDARPHVRDYVEHGDLDDAFLRAVLTNDLRASVHLSTLNERTYLVDLVVFLELFAPVGSWGSSDAVANWVHRGGRAGGAALIADVEHAIAKGRN